MQNHFHGAVMISQIIDIFILFCLYRAYIRLFYIFEHYLDFHVLWKEKNCIWRIQAQFGHLQTYCLKTQGKVRESMLVGNIIVCQIIQKVLITKNGRTIFFCNKLLQARCFLIFNFWPLKGLFLIMRRGNIFITKIDHSATYKITWGQLVSNNQDFGAKTVCMFMTEVNYIFHIIFCFFFIQYEQF